MKEKQVFIIILTIGLISCYSTPKGSTNHNTYDQIHIAGAMKNVMWKGQLQGIINLDTIGNTEGLYGIGPESYLTGEILINDGKTYVSRVTSDTTMTVEETFNTSAPFFVYGNVNDWYEIELPKNIKNISELESFIDHETKDLKRPFAFKLAGKINHAVIHVQNLPKGTKVSSPKEAHQGQTNYILQNEEVEMVGFFSTQHKGIFTHHDSYIHIHLINKNQDKMGHLDEVEIEKMRLYLPKK